MFNKVPHPTHHIQSDNFLGYYNFIRAPQNASLTPWDSLDSEIKTRKSVMMTGIAISENSTSKMKNVVKRN